MCWSHIDLFLLVQPRKEQFTNSMYYMEKIKATKYLEHNCFFVLSFLLGVKEREMAPSSCCCEWWMDCLEGYASFGSSLSCMILIYSSRMMGFGFWGWQRFKGW